MQVASNTKWLSDVLAQCEKGVRLPILSVILSSLIETCPLAMVLIDTLAMCLQVTVDFPIIADPEF